MADVAKLKRDFEALRADRAQLEGTWDEIERYILPLTGKTRDTSKALKTDYEAWDFTAALANEHLAAALGANVTPSSARWHGFEWQDPQLREDQEALAYLEQLTEMTWLELRNSDFAMEIGAGYLEYTGLGNMVLVVEPTSEEETKWEGLDFTCVPVREAFFQDSSRGEVEQFFRCIRWSPLQIKERFEDDGELPRRILDAVQAGGDKANERLDVVFAIWCREGIEKNQRDDAGKPRPLAPGLRPYGYCYFLADGGDQLGSEGGYYEMPVVVGRWARKPGMTWGFGRGNVALKSVKYLCGYLEAARAAAEKVVDPALLVTERGLLGDVNLGAGEYTVVAGIDDLKPLESSAKFDVSRDVIQDLRMEIRRLFHEDDLQLKDSPQMTATEVQARRDLMDRSLGAPVGRLQNDVLSPLLRIVLAHLDRAGKLPKPPESVKSKKAEVAVSYFGAISRAQRIDEVAAIERGAALVASLVQSDPERFGKAALILDPVQTIREAFLRLGTPAKMLKSDAVVQREARDQAAAQARQAQAETALTEASAAAKAAQASSAAGGSPLGIELQPALNPSTGMPA